MDPVIPETMTAVLLTAHGGPECLEVRHDVPVPIPGAGEVLVRVLAAGVNNTDVNTRVGWYSGGGWTGSFTFPRIQGIDLCGRIAAIGPGVAVDRIGERVLVEPCWREPGAPLTAARFLGSEVDGAFAQFCVVPSRHAHAVESALDDVHLAAVPCSWSTAENMLHRTALERGENVLVTGASGGVGSAAVSLAAARGARVLAMAGSEKHDALLSCGAAAVIDRDADPAEEFGPDSVDVVVDVVGGAGFAALLGALRPGGRYAVAGAIGGPEVTLDLRTLYLKDQRLLGCTVLDDGVFARLVDRIERSEVTPIVSATYPLERIHDAQADFLTKRHVGKLVLTIP